MKPTLEQQNEFLDTIEEYLDAIANVEVIDKRLNGLMKKYPYKGQDENSCFPDTLDRYRQVRKKCENLGCKLP